MPAFVPLSLPSAEKHGAAVVLCFGEYNYIHIFNCMPQFDNFEFGGPTTETEVYVQEENESATERKMFIALEEHELSGVPKNAESPITTEWFRNCFVQTRFWCRSVATF